MLRNGANRDANVSALNFAAYDKTNTYAVTGGVRYSNIFGFTSYNYIESPYKYISNIDTATVNGRLYVAPYHGFRTSLNAGKVSGKIQYMASVNVESDAYDPNDLGYLEAPNEVSYSAMASYNQFTPTKTFLKYSYTLQLIQSRMYKPSAPVSTELQANTLWIFKNFWDVSLNAGVLPFWQNDYFELQTANRFVKKPPYLYAIASGSTDSRKRLYFSYNFGIADGGMFKNNMYVQTIGSVRYRFSKKFSASLEADRRHDNLQIGYAFIRDGGAPILVFATTKMLQLFFPPTTILRRA